MKILINNKYGGFGFSEQFIRELEKRTGKKFNTFKCERTDLDVIELFEEWGTRKSSGGYASLKLIEIPDDVDWVIEQYDGVEWVAEVHRTWG